MCCLKTLLMTIKRRQRFLFMRVPKLSLMRLFITLLTKQLLLINAIPIRSIIQTLQTLLRLRIPFSDLRIRLISIHIPIRNIKLPYVLRHWLQKVLMIIYGHLLFAACQVHWVVFLCIVVKILFGDRCWLVNWQKVFYCNFKQEHTVCLWIAQTVLKFAFLLNPSALKNTPFLRVRLIII